MTKVRMWIKRWWVVAAITGLGFSLTSCSKRRAGGDNSGFASCEGSMGTFEINVYPTAKKDLYELHITPVTLAEPTDIAQINIANPSVSYRTQVPQVVLNNDQSIFAGFLTGQDLERFDIVAITPFEPGVSFPEQNTDREAFCELPLPPDKIETKAP